MAKGLKVGTLYILMSNTKYQMWLLLQNKKTQSIYDISGWVT